MASSPNDGEAEYCCYSNSSGTLCPSGQGRAVVGFGEEVKKKKLWTSGWPWKPLITLGWEPGEEQWGWVAQFRWEGGMAHPEWESSSEQGSGVVRLSVGVQLRLGVGPAQRWNLGQNGDVHMESRLDAPVQNGEPSNWEVIQPSVRVQLRLGDYLVQSRGPVQFWGPAQTGG